MAKKIVIEKDLSIPMRDGTVLKGDLYRPDGPRTATGAAQPHSLRQVGPDAAPGDGPGASRAQRLQRADPGLPRALPSAGTWTCFISELQDGYDTVEWAARQPWADGKVGTWGPSYMGVTQWLAATQAPPSLKAMAPA